MGSRRQRRRFDDMTNVAKTIIADAFTAVTDGTWGAWRP